mgnify:CR=1 FL=1
MKTYLTNQNISVTLPEIDNVEELVNEEKNANNIDDYREEIIYSLSKRNKKVLKILCKKIIDLDGHSSEEILSRNEKWLKNIYRFSKEFNPIANLINKRNFYIDNRLVKKGFLTNNIDIGKIRTASEKLLNDKKKKLEEGNKYGWDNIVEADQSIIRKLNKEFEKKGLLDEARAYLSRDVSVKACFIILSTPSDQQYKHFLGDVKKFNKKYINFHIDPKGGLVKAMVYLNNVEEKSGPFQIVDKSINLNIDPVKMIFARAISTANYCDSYEKRLLINSLPKGLRSSLNFGRMLKKDSNLTHFINKNISTITSEEANTILFIPDKTIHRGAVCESKNRLAMQIHIF